MVNAAIQNAKTFVSDSLSKLKRMNKIDKAEYVKWFGSYDNSRHQRVKTCFTKIQECLNNGFRWYKINKFLYGDHDLFGRIYFGTLFWFAPAVATTSDPDSQAGTVIHELSHKAGMTKDYKYGVYECKDLALTSPQKAVKNTDNYAYYAEAIP